MHMHSLQFAVYIGNGIADPNLELQLQTDDNHAL